MGVRFQNLSEEYPTTSATFLPMRAERNYGKLEYCSKFSVVITVKGLEFLWNLVPTVKMPRSFIFLFIDLYGDDW